MTSVLKITPEYIKALSYTDFVGFVNQWNVLPGSYSTLSKWAVHARMGTSSRLLEVACTTGFTSRELAVLTGCQAEGFDLSKASIKMAQYNHKHYAPDCRLEYQVGDGYKIDISKKYSHIAVGASLKFFPDPTQIFNRCVGALEEGGFLLASPFYVEKPLPDALVHRAEGVFGITPTAVPYKEIMQLYAPLEIIFEERNSLVKETNEELDAYCQSTIDRACQIREIDDQAVYDSMLHRLRAVKEMSNDLRPYQMYTVLVLRYRKSVYPHRYVELF